MSLRDFLRRAATLPIVVYRKLISPLTPPSCIYVPTCSAYAEAAIRRHGVPAGLLLTVARLLRCVGALFVGGEDPVPEEFSLRATWDGYRKFWRRRPRGGAGGRAVV